MYDFFSAIIPSKELVLPSALEQTTVLLLNVMKGKSTLFFIH